MAERWQFVIVQEINVWAALQLIAKWYFNKCNFNCESLFYNWEPIKWCHLGTFGIDTGSEYI